MNRILIFILLLAFVNINAQNDTIQEIKINSDFILPYLLAKDNALNEDLSLIIETYYDECGEWGGHYEKITISSDSVGDIHATYDKYSINCDSSYYYNRIKEFNIQPELTKKTKLNKEKIKSIKKYCLEVLQAKLEMGRGGHSGKRFIIQHPEGINIRYTDYFSYKGFEKNYEKFLDKLEFK